ncbi:TPA: hypothetical protein NGT82_004656 [Vibrio parahaemolyticus]|nr:hypothetical protein [Vibrio parahaemolyticus]MDF4398783.1 hypothetical protein [Vibrio parahaemolyticus]HCE2905308.1 hypothetical protein [Vibrio parahaemolyticus]HCE4641256.1 hypothetical protein [Vibrio parahaemolyticus]HCG8159240.1 hypothetical protein [Vibrio parahaemolyticus]
MKKALWLVFLIGLGGCAAREPSSELQSQNQCYETSMENKLSKLNGILPAGNEQEIISSHMRLQQAIQNWMLTHQQANDIFDPVGGISSSLYGKSDAKKDYERKFRDLSVVLSDPNLSPKVAEYVFLSISNSFEICYGSR